MSTTAARPCCPWGSPSFPVFSPQSLGFQQSDYCQQEDKEMQLKLQSCFVIAK